MNQFYLFDSPTVDKLKLLKQEYSNLDIPSVLLYLELQKSYKKMKINHDLLLQKFNLSEAKFSIMMLLSYEKDMILSPSSLSEKIGSKKSTITGVIQGLEKMNLIKRKTFPNDKRTNYVQLTELGLNKLNEFLPFNYELVSNTFDVLDEEEKKQFLKLTNKLRNSLEKENLL